MKAIWQINDKEGKKLGLIKTPDYLDIIDVTLRAKNMYGEGTDLSPIF